MPLVIALLVMPALAAPSLEEAWTRGMRPRSDAAEQLATRIRTTAHRAAQELAADARAAAARRKYLQWLAAGAAAAALVFAISRVLAARRNREEQRLRSVLEIARRRDEERR